METTESELRSEAGDIEAFLAGLTEPQRQAVTHVEGPLLVLAGPGSGKTRVITGRIAHLVLKVGLAPWNVLAITFTNKAAAEMRQRASQMLTPRQSRAVTLTTFHSFCARILRDHGERIGLPSGYSIYDTDDQNRAIKLALTELNISSEHFPPANLRNTISSAKNELVDAEAFAAGALDFYSKTVAKVYRKYQAVLKKNHAVDFDDLLLSTVRLMRQHSDVLDHLRDRFQYLLIDEYQDTNHAQFVIAQCLASEHQNLCVTGDPDQSIYSWRGANIRNILDFEQTFPAATVVRLEQNFRSTKRIVASADAVIQHNTARKHKSLWTDNEVGDPVRVVRCADEKSESTHVAQWFARMHDQENLAWRDMAVLYRTNSISRAVEEALRDASIPYQVARGTAFYDRREVRDCVAYLRIVANPEDEINLARIINTPARGISVRTVKALQAHAAAHQTTLHRLTTDPAAVSGLQSRAVTAITHFGQMLDAWVQATDHPEPMSLRDLTERVLRESGMEAFYRIEKNDPDTERIANLGELISSAQQFDLELDGDTAPSHLRTKLEAYLERISLISDIDAVDKDQGAVTLMTLHAAKGLEFPVAAIVGVEDGLLPHSQSIEDPHQLEEERRLLFVGMTRAQRRLTICHCQSRTVFGYEQPVMASRFLRELDDAQVELTEVETDMAPLRSQRQGGGPFPPGTMVRHPQFGLGRVMHVSAMGGDWRAMIQFAAVGTKTLVLSYARLEIVS